MRMREIGFEGQPPIDGYGPGGFRIAGSWVEGSVLCAPSGVGDLEMPLGDTGIARVIGLAAEIDILLVGMGAEIAPLPADVRQAIEAAGIGVEVMSTPSACRTYNVLLSEGRRVACALTAV
ncbi:MAG: Mth938-like domain-containing protein [Pseudomonadota bacterium]